MVDHEQALDALDREIRRLRIEYERFFSGNLPTPPDELREQIEERFRKLRATQVRSHIAQFRLGGLEARFNSYSELYNRRMRESEQRPTRPIRTAQASAPAAPQPRTDRDGFVVGEAAHHETVRSLYQELQRRGQPVRADLGAFETYLLGQVDRIRSHTGCREVEFRVVADDGGVRLRARPLGTTNPG